MVWLLARTVDGIVGTMGGRHLNMQPDNWLQLSLSRAAGNFSGFCLA